MGVYLFIAALHNKPVEVFVTNGFDPGPRLTYLLNLTKASIPRFQWHQQMNNSEILDGIAESLSQFRQSKTPPLRQEHLIGRLHSHWYTSRAKQNNRPHGERPVLLLDGIHEPNRPPPRLDLVDHLLVEEMRVQHSDERMGRLWMATRELFVAPFDEATNEELDLWHRTLQRWCKNAGWYKLHGMSYLGFAAAGYSLAQIRRIARHRGQDLPGWDPQYYEAQPVASALYSTAKAMPTLTERIDVLKDGLVHLDRGRDARGGINSALAHMYGSYSLELERDTEAIGFFEQGLRLAEAEGIHTGVSLSELGFAHLQIGNTSKALPLLEAGEMSLRKHMDNPGFYSRALRKLIWGYRANKMYEKALEAEQRLDELVEKFGLYDQFSNRR